ncbi:hypothetical protein [Aeromicrobium sp. NPDC092404]|uniref:hypothetical protein n=1 Tax=Aeromicrobium sp. NPDC092404 TaxID=3154976 RepID=UPI003414D538
MRSIRMIVAAMLATAGLVAVGATTQAGSAATTTKDLSASYVNVMKYETFRLKGRVSTFNARPVWLQYRDGKTGSWKTKTKATSSANGNFSFFPSTYKTRYFRYYAPPSGGKKSIIGNAKKITVVSQKVSVQIIRQTQCHFADNPTSDVTFVYTFYPARAGRNVDFASSAVDLSDFTDSRGRVAFRFNPGKTNGTYQAAATAKAYEGAAPLASGVSQYSITQCQIIFFP